MTSGTDDAWRRRFLAAQVGFPAWSAQRPERLFHLGDGDGSTQLWCHDLASGRSSRLTDQAVGVESFVVLPDGSGAAWWSDDTGSEHGAWVVTDADGGAARPLLADVPAGWAQGLSLRPGAVALGLADDATYRVLVARGGEPAQVRYESARPAGLGREWESAPYGGLSADARLLCLRHTERGDILHHGLRVLDAASGDVLVDLLDDGLTLTVGAWSPVEGDQRLTFVHEQDGVDRPAVWSATDGRRDYPLDLPGPVDVAGWWPDGSAVLLVHQHLGRRSLHRLDPTSGAVELVHDPRGWVSGAGVRPDGAVWLREESAGRAPLVRSTAGDVVLAAPGPPPPIGRPHRSVLVAGPGGPTHVQLCEPAGDAPYPTVLLVHGGPEWSATDDLDPWEQALVDHGYLVASVDYRGSTGSTVAWRTALHDGNIGLLEVADVVAALDHLVDAGLTDPSRVAVEGWSWGGYVSLLAAGLHPDRFAAVVGGVPVGDLVMCHEDCSPPQQEYDLAVLGGGPEELPALYAERSPVTYVDRVCAPVLLIAGEHDSACPIRQVRHYADALRAAGGHVRLHVHDAGHHANAVDEQLRHAELELDFLATTLSHGT